MTELYFLRNFGRSALDDFSYEEVLAIMWATRAESKAQEEAVLNEELKGSRSKAEELGIIKRK
ncbi:MAG: hypothetical protein GY847_01435 [Proteobacteria bacterium]|nr:hypothetical protein [Pseudomonadota bacterium]